MSAEEAKTEVVIEQPKTEVAPEAEKPPVETTEEVKAEAKAEEAEAEKKDRDEKGRFKGARDRIDELTRARREAEREAAYWRQMASANQEPAPEKPTPDKFSDYGEYVEALTDWKAAQAAEKAAAKLLEQRAQVHQAETRQSSWAERVTATKQEISDYEDVMSEADMPVARHVQEVLMESDVGPKVAYHLAKNPDVLARLNTMSPTAAAREVGRLEASLAQPKDPPPAKLTNAPKPAAVSAPKGSGATSKDPSSMSMEEYKAWRKSQGAMWAR